MSISLDQAQVVVANTIAEARKLDLKPVSVIVLDPRGSIVSAGSEDGVSAMRAQIAHGKANAAIQLGMERWWRTESSVSRSRSSPGLHSRGISNYYQQYVCDLRTHAARCRHGRAF